MWGIPVPLLPFFVSRVSVFLSKVRSRRFELAGVGAVRQARCGRHPRLPAAGGQERARDAGEVVAHLRGEGGRHVDVRGGLPRSPVSSTETPAPVVEARHQRLHHVEHGLRRPRDAHRRQRAREVPRRERLAQRLDPRQVARRVGPQVRHQRRRRVELVLRRPPRRTPRAPRRRATRRARPPPPRPASRGPFAGSRGTSARGCAARSRPPRGSCGGAPSIARSSASTKASDGALPLRRVRRERAEQHAVDALRQPRHGASTAAARLRGAAPPRAPARAPARTGRPRRAPRRRAPRARRRPPAPPGARSALCSSCSGAE